ncbi:MAG TPA: zf-TFIIB domain-containing protein [Armatimonadota bacterium]|nr:zf-TFIIB domain-containing protein [Armatimonadota bacterium]
MSSKTCPRCNEPLTVAKAPGMELDVCRTCGGVHFDHGELAQMTIKRRDELDAVERLVEPDEATAPRGIDTRGLVCPACAARMESYEYSFCSGITLDRCPECFAIWVDDGELQAIQDHLEEGHTPTRPVAPAAGNDEAAIALAQMDSHVQHARNRAKAIRSFTGSIAMRHIIHLPW